MEIEKKYLTKSDIKISIIGGSIVGLMIDASFLGDFKPSKKFGNWILKEEFEHRIHIRFTKLNRKKN